MADVMEFTRGDGLANTKGFSIPAASWVPGGRLYFAAKQVVDDDLTDAAAEIKGNWGDDVVTDTVRGGVAYKRYNCVFPPSATGSIDSGGADSIELKGEFQWVSPTGDPVTSPPNDQKIDVILYFDINRRVSP